MATFHLTAEVFAILSTLIEEHAGLHYDLRDKDLLADKVGSRAQEAGFDSPLDYYYYLRYDPAGLRELDALIDALVVNETYFCREVDALRAAITHHLAPLIQAGRRPRVWCAACSTGEEPLTLAMLLTDEGLLANTAIVASDISRRALARAREGSYGPRSMRAMPKGVEERHLEMEGDRARVRRHLRDAVEWRRINLLDRKAVASLGFFDLVLCRNVFIYFSDVNVTSVVSSIASVLRPGGCLLVGASESLMRFGTLLQSQERGGAFFYVKPSP